IPSYQVYKGTVFDLVDQAVDFVMSKINRFVGTREHGPEAPVEYEFPMQAVSEAIVNAVCYLPRYSRGVEKNICAGASSGTSIRL
ncbi:MAG: hypothetical protein V1736_04230, partial [Pseudomonadota bacterium]